MNRIVRWMNIRWVNCSHLDDACILAEVVRWRFLQNYRALYVGKEGNVMKGVKFLFFFSNSRDFYKSLILKKLKFKQRENYEFKDCYFFDA